MQALDSKAEGIRINAMKVLGQWGDKESIVVLQSLLADHVKSSKHTIVNVLVGQLLPHIARLDRQWVIELYFTDCNSMTRHHLRDLLYAFPFKATAAALAARYRSGKNVDQIPGILDNMQFHAFTHKRKD